MSTCSRRRKKGIGLLRARLSYSCCVCDCAGESLVLPGCIGVFSGTRQFCTVFIGWRKRIPLRQAPVPVPEFTASDKQIQTVHERWQDFEQKTRAGQPAEIELTADDINTLIATNQDMRGKIFVSIDGEQLAFQTSVPLGELIAAVGLLF